jgi:hypothetical protein
MTDYEQLARIRQAWLGFLATVGPMHERLPGGARVVPAGRTDTPRCDPIAFRDGTLTVAARHNNDQELVQKDLAAAPADRISAAFGDGVVTSFVVVAGDDAVAVLQQELADVGLQVQRLLALVSGKA